MATCLWLWSARLFVCTALTIMHQVNIVRGSSSTVTSSIFADPLSVVPTPTITISSLASASSATPTGSPVTTVPSQSPLERHLALIIGVPTGVGLSIIGLSLCLIWLACSSYCEYRKSQPQLGNTGSAGTRSTNVHANTTNSNSKSATIPMKQVSTSASESHAFQPEPDPELESGRVPQKEVTSSDVEQETS